MAPPTPVGAERLQKTYPARTTWSRATNTGPAQPEHARAEYESCRRTNLERDTLPSLSVGSAGSEINLGFAPLSACQAKPSVSEFAKTPLD